MTIDNLDIISARITQSRAVLATITHALEGGDTLPAERIAAALWAVDTLLDQAEKASE